MPLRPVSLLLPSLCFACTPTKSGASSPGAGAETTEAGGGTDGSSDPVDSGDPNTGPDDTGEPIEDGCDAYADPTLDPADSSADGSADHPWPSLEALASSGQLPIEGGVLCLLPGDHGSPHVQGVHPDAPLILRAVPPTEATVSALRITDTTDLTVDGLQVQPPATPPDGIDPREHFLVVGDATSDRITLTNLRVESADSSATWTVADWARLSWSGIDLAGADATVSHSTIHNTHHALLLRGDRAHATTNLIDNFGGDGIRGLASGSTYEWNTVRDAYIDDYAVQHDDAFQAYELEGDLRISDVTLRHNRFVLFADPITEFVRTEHLIATLMQGVVITDGYADGWVVEDNLVVNSQAHGITLYGARNSRIQNNTVVRHPDVPAEAGPWIRITDQTKSGHANFDNIIRNNLTTLLTPWDYDATSLVEANLEIDDPTAHFVDPGGLDFHLLPTSPAVDGGVDTDLTDVDLDGQPRVVGSAVDLGAHEHTPD